MPGLRGKADVNVHRGTLTQLRTLARLSPGQTPTHPGTGSTTPPAPSTAVWPLLKNGTRGVNVTAAQRLLAAAGRGPGAACWPLRAAIYSAEERHCPPVEC